MSRYQPYPSYKQGDIEWLGEIPEHWEVGLLSSLFVDNKEKNAGIKNNNLLSLSYGRIIQKDIDTNEGLLPESFESYQIVHSGYIVLRLTDLQNDKKSLRTGFVKETGIITSAYTGLAKKSKSIGDERYFHLYLHTFDLHKGFYGMGAGVRQGLNFDELKKLKFLLPPTNEQTLIADFLDRETAKIDTLIIKQERMIELLNEKRSTIISHAVTKGLDSNVKMKDSGVEWLGEVPENWNFDKFRYIFNFSKGLTITKADLMETGIPCVNYGEIHSKYGFEVSAERHALKCVDSSYIETDKSSLMSNGDFVFADTSEDLEGAGNFTHVSGDTNIFAGYHTIIARQRKNNNARFLAYLIDSKVFRTQIRLAVKGVKVFSITQAILRDSSVWLPNITEQMAISNFLDDKTAKIDTLVAKARQAIELMKERRTALISAAVTGKIDVKGIA